MYNIKNIASILHADDELKQPSSVIAYLLIDSRRVAFPATSLFFAITAARRDGHSYIEECYKQGVRNFVVEKKPAIELIDANFLVVPNTLDALQMLAANRRMQFNYPVIGITGSNGKTIVKEWLYQLLSGDYNIIRSPRSYNSQIGVPLSVWQMSEAYNLAIIEAGISQCGEMDKLQRIIQPTIGVFTTIGDAHGENFTSIESKANEKVRLFESAAIIVFCGGKKPIVEAVKSLSDKGRKLFSWGYSAENTLQIISVVKGNDTSVITAQADQKQIALTIPFTDDASIENAITCWCVCLCVRLSHDSIVSRMMQLKPVDMRLQLIEAENNCSLINDSYSFDITSFNIALDFLLQQQLHTDKTVIISDIPAAGSDDHLYAEAANILHAKKIKRVIAIGKQWLMHEHLLRKKIPVTEFYAATDLFIQQVTSNHFKNETILLKGARAFAFEKIVSLLEKKVHQTLMEINLTALSHNLRQYQAHLQKGTKLMAMVKAFGYGSGSAEVANVLQFANVDYVAVAYPDEGVELRKAGIRLPILVLNVDEHAFESLIEHNLEPELFSFQIFTAFNNFLLKEALQQYPVHIKLDTGMHRLGFEEKDIDQLSAMLKGNKNMVVKSVFSHLASSEDPADDAFTLQQAHIFERCCITLQAALNYTFIKHIANSAAIFRLPQVQYDLVRLGIGLYGVDSANEHQLSLQTVATLKTTIAQLRNVNAGDTIGYNRSGKVLKDSMIATIRIGYADGFNRRLSNGAGHVYIKGQLAPVIGKVCMDMTMIDVTNIPQINEGDEVEIFGRNIPVTTFAKWSGTIAYEVLTSISQRVKRVYIQE